MPTMRFKHDVNAQEATQARKVNPNEVAPPKKPAPPKPPVGGQQTKPVEKKPDQAKPVVQPPNPLPLEPPPVPPKKTGVFARIGKLFGGSNAENEEQAVSAVPQKTATPETNRSVVQAFPPSVSPSSKESVVKPAETSADAPVTSTQSDVEADALLSDLDALLKSTEAPALPVTPVTSPVNEAPLPVQEEANDVDADALLSSLNALLTPTTASVPVSQTSEATEAPVSENALPGTQESGADSDADAMLADLDMLLSTGDQGAVAGTKDNTEIPKPDTQTSSTDNVADALLADLDALLSAGEHDGAAPKTEADAKGVAGEPDTSDSDADALLADLDKLLAGDKPSAEPQ